MKKAFVMVELLISVLLISVLLTVLVVLLVNLSDSNKNQTEAIQEVINRSEDADYDTVVTLNNGLRLETVSKNGYIIEYLR